MSSKLKSFLADAPDLFEVAVADAFDLSEFPVVDTLDGSELSEFPVAKVPDVGSEFAAAVTFDLNFYQNLSVRPAESERGRSISNDHTQP